MTPSHLFDLNIEEVLEHWEVEHAVREVIANALDEQLLTATTEVQIEEPESGVCTIRDFGRTSPSVKARRSWRDRMGSSASSASV